MDLLQAEINRKRKVSAALIDEINPDKKVGQTRYFRQGDLKQLEEDKIKAKQEEIDLKRVKHAQENDTVEEDESSRMSREAASDKAKVLDRLSTLDVKSIKNRLRNLMQPITLFGESDEARVTRLSTVLSEDGDEDDYRLTANYSTTNTFLGNRSDKERRSSNKEEDDIYEEDEDEGTGMMNKVRSNDEVNVNNDGEVMIGGDDEDPNTSDNTGSSSFKKGEILTNYSSSPGLSNEKIIHKYFRNLLKQWEWDLDDRDDVTKRTSKGKMETRTQKQCKDYIRPLFKLCKNKEVPWDISDKLVKIVTACENGDFRSAHDHYLQAAIGKAAWPIGLTMVGIHERSGREKISTSKVAHVMNNELQRKYFTSVKRLMTYAQTKRSDVAPSMKSL